MKKTTILAGAMILAAAILAVWFAPERPDDRDLGTSAADAAISSPPTPHNPVVQSRNTVGPSTELPVDAGETQTPSPRGNEPVRLFSQAEYGTQEYRDAWFAVETYLVQSDARDAATGNRTRSRTQLVDRDDAAVNELIRQLDANNGLTSAFQVSPVEVRACTVSSVARTDPSFARGQPIRGNYRAVAKCDESGDTITVAIDRNLQGTIVISIFSDQGGVDIYSIDDSGFAMALQYYPIRM
jgi:hypothetical protein